MQWPIASQAIARRAQISKALNARSNAVKTAVERYNIAAAGLSPPRPIPKVAEALDYVFLGQSDLLRHSRHGILEKPWAKAGARDAATIYFKLKCAREEVERVDFEARRLVKFMADVEARVKDAVRSLKSANEVPLALQLEKHGRYLSSVHTRHRKYLRSILSPADMDSIVSPALRPFECTAPPVPPTIPQTVPSRDDPGIPQTNQANADFDEEEDREEEEEEERAYDALLAINRLTFDDEDIAR